MQPGRPTCLLYTSDCILSRVILCFFSLYLTVVIFTYILINMSNLTTKRKLTEKQESFLNNLIETKGNLKLSAELAGYAGNHYQVLRSLKHEIVDLASDVLAREAPHAAFKLVEVLDSDEAMPQANVKLQAAQTILDRVGLGKKERLDVNHNVQGGIFILPEKETIDITQADYEDIPD